jgi:hypothetical protein
MPVIELRSQVGVRSLLRPFHGLEIQCAFPPGVSLTLHPRLYAVARSAGCVLFALLLSGCAASQKRQGLPPDVESTIGIINEEIAAERYEKIYNDASELWRQDATLDQSTATFKTLRAKLGLVENRTLQSATEQDNSSGPLQGRAYIVLYRTKFQNGEAMETFTLVERDRRWLLARYFVNSTALK